MSKQNQTLPNGIAVIVNDDGILQKIIHDSYGLFSLQGEETISFVDCLESDSIPKAYQFIKRINTNDVAYNWELHVTDGDEMSLFSFSGIRFDDENLLIGTANSDDTEQFLNGLMEMNNESINKLRSFMKEQQQPTGSKNDEWAMYDQMSGLNNELANMQRKLTKKTAKLERINELKNQMLGMAAHDLRNPLTLIQNYSNFLIEDHEEQDIFTDDQFQLVKEMKQSSEYMVQIIENMLDISAIESGSINLDKKDEDIGKLIERIVSLNRPTANKKDISLVTKVPDIPITKEIDAHKFQQVLDNLVSNAIKYSQSQTEVEVGISEKAGSAITIYIEDEGQGIPEDELEDLFVPFAKISSEPTAGEKSTGLGLAIAKKIVEAHGGDIQVESEVGVGSTFFVNIP
ncbi:HAMP domain-containing sensor histidine kinase [Fodinibius sp.]|uniref:sensor histidine kinase n=1 Tax=Fodinibius sp. TaxID=1872440 RepID=UPI002ACDEA05|nr:HAMP domain-containing sensor histidine kinase [Fodinibius sp.]MDZ7659293.1 HAMP domain-containing sensor histidine kinase [Fodinibius sp.]